MAQKYNGKEKFGWTAEDAPKVKLSQCHDCSRLELVKPNDGSADFMNCDIFGDPRPAEYVSGKVTCPWYDKEGE